MPSNVNVLSSKRVLTETQIKRTFNSQFQLQTNSDCLNKHNIIEQTALHTKLNDIQKLLKNYSVQELQIKCDFVDKLESLPAKRKHFRGI